MNKAAILVVGKVERFSSGWVAHGWEMDCDNDIRPYELRDGEILLGGWTLAELREVQSRPTEFCLVPSPDSG